ncbi:hypothetical protein BJ085DRAFT_30777 [Dimargaris cristalligena]|uniref:Uncharacterized protein n=1 Tax=Dimargaris cristalligena TaxID=215637 RepID=A0A4P9ZKS2_9FUNG|nr:hypothetical protein BJ085DRAFT_30777 [Dimargaris cristalligena]|eukprot:RKP33847.1 hypothetical protein BJ085DRAFT_30777 [Dimargaris cristalligena]
MTGSLVWESTPVVRVVNSSPRDSQPSQAKLKKIYEAAKDNKDTPTRREWILSQIELNMGKERGKVYSIQIYPTINQAMVTPLSNNDIKRFYENEFDPKSDIPWVICIDLENPAEKDLFDYIESGMDCQRAYFSGLNGAVGGVGSPIC